MKFEILYTERAGHDLQMIDRAIARRIFEKLRSLSQLENPMKQAKALQGQFKGLYRFRVGDYRAIFQKNVDGKIIVLTILSIKHRKQVYE